MTLSSPFKDVTDSNGVILKGGDGRTVTVKANGSDLFLGAGVSYQNETNEEDVDLAAAGEAVDGVIVGEAFPYKVDLDKDSDDCYDDNSYLQMYVPEPGDILYGTVATATSLSKDAYVKFSGGFLTSSTRSNAIGRNRGGAITGASGTEQVIPYEWGVQ